METVMFLLNVYRCIYKRCVFDQPVVTLRERWWWRWWWWWWWSGWWSRRNNEGYLLLYTERQWDSVLSSSSSSPSSSSFRSAVRCGAGDGLTAACPRVRGSVNSTKRFACFDIDAIHLFIMCVSVVHNTTHRYRSVLGLYYYVRVSLCIICLSTFYVEQWRTRSEILHV